MSIQCAAKHFASGQIAGTKAQLSEQPVVLKSLVLLNTTAAVAYLQIFNMTSDAVTVGTTTPTLSIGIPANGAIVVPCDDGIVLGNTGLTIAGTTTRTGSTGAAIDYTVAWD
jgi:hypothetical protein